MKYIDRIYGHFNITEPVILELISAPSIQRLKGVDQLGNFAPFYKGVKYSRYEHSIGVFLLLKRFGAPIEEQISGLIHDVSHSVFSHCIDYALDAGSEKEHSHQDDILDDFIKKSEIPTILRKYGFDLEYILDDNNFPLKENGLPDLCADRIDYTLRNMVVFNKENNINQFVNNLVICKNDWVFKDAEIAVRFAEDFYNLNKDFYLSLPAAVMLYSVGDCLRYSLSKNYISEADLYTTDEYILQKLKEYLKGDLKLSYLFDRMNNKVGYNNNPKDYDCKVFCKSRVADPLCIYNGKVEHVSSIMPEWQELIEYGSMPAEFYIKFD